MFQSAWYLLLTNKQEARSGKGEPKGINWSRNHGILGAERDLGVSDSTFHPFPEARGKASRLYLPRISRSPGEGFPQCPLQTCAYTWELENLCNLDFKEMSPPTPEQKGKLKIGLSLLSLQKRIRCSITCQALKKHSKGRYFTKGCQISKVLWTLGPLILPSTKKLKADFLKCTTWESMGVRWIKGSHVRYGLNTGLIKKSLIKKITYQ